MFRRPEDRSNVFKYKRQGGKPPRGAMSWSEAFGVSSQGAGLGSKAAAYSKDRRKPKDREEQEQDFEGFRRSRRRKKPRKGAKDGGLPKNLLVRGEIFQKKRRRKRKRDEDYYSLYSQVQGPLTSGKSSKESDRDDALYIGLPRELNKNLRKAEAFQKASGTLLAAVESGALLLEKGLDKGLAKDALKDGGSVKGKGAAKEYEPPWDQTKRPSGHRIPISDMRLRALYRSSSHTLRNKAALSAGHSFGRPDVFAEKLGTQTRPSPKISESAKPEGKGGHPKGRKPKPSRKRKVSTLNQGITSKPKATALSNVSPPYPLKAFRYKTSVNGFRVAAQHNYSLYNKRKGWSLGGPDLKKGPKDVPGTYIQKPGSSGYGSQNPPLHPAISLRQDTHRDTRGQDIPQQSEVKPDKLRSSVGLALLAGTSLVTRKAVKPSGVVAARIGREIIKDSTSKDLKTLAAPITDGAKLAGSASKNVFLAGKNANRMMKTTRKISRASIKTTMLVIKLAKAKALVGAALPLMKGIGAVAILAAKKAAAAVIGAVKLAAAAVLAAKAIAVIAVVVALVLVVSFFAMMSSVLVPNVPEDEAISIAEMVRQLDEAVNQSIREAEEAADYADFGDDFYYGSPNTRLMTNLHTFFAILMVKHDNDFEDIAEAIRELHSLGFSLDIYTDYGYFEERQEDPPHDTIFQWGLVAHISLEIFTVEQMEDILGFDNGQRSWLADILENMSLADIFEMLVPHLFGMARPGVPPEEWSYLMDGQISWPVPAGFGRHSITGATGHFGAVRSSGVHRGIDIIVPIGTPIYAAKSGWVTTSQDRGGHTGVMISITSESGVVTRYIHLMRGSYASFGLTSVHGVPVGQGVWVERGQQIALSGNSGAEGTSSGHLHFDLLMPDTNFPGGLSSSVGYRSGTHVFVDPLLFLP